MQIRQPTAIARPGQGELHLWRMSLCRSPDELAELRRSLSDDEARRADSFRFDVHRHRFIAGRGLLRRVLAGYLGCGPREVAFRYSQYGQPLLDGPPGGAPLAFNLAHSADEALVAVTPGSRIGVDLEQIRPLTDLASVARSAFSVRECRELFSLAADEQEAAFFRIWTRKEAVLKALGTGFSLPSRSFVVTVLPGEAPRLISAPAGAMPIDRWTLADVPVAAGYAAAVAVEHPGVVIVMQSHWA